MTTFDERHPAPNPYLPDLDFTGGDWTWDDDDDVTEPDEDEVPGVGRVLATLLGYAAALALLLICAAVLIPIVIV